MRHTASKVQRLEYCACGADIFSGTVGIGFFLGHLFAATNERLFALTAEGAMRQALSVLDDIPLKRRRSYYLGLPGIAYVAMELATLIDRPTFLPIAALLLDEADSEDLPDGTKSRSILDSADMVISSLSIFSRRTESVASEHALETALRHGDRICNVDGFGEGPAMAGIGPLSVSYALLALARETGRMKYHSAALKYLPSHSLAEPIARLDREGFRGREASPAWTQEVVSSLAAPRRTTLEVALLRLHSRQIAGRDDLPIDLQHIKRRALTPPPVTALADISVATGTAGDIELLLRLGQAVADSSYVSAAERLGLAELARIGSDDGHWPCGTVPRPEVPGLMLGNAGIGYVLLRLFDPVRVPPFPKPPLL
jgi:lantibiotic biosynthesis protein